VNEKLKNEGWTVLCFWDNEVMKELNRCIEETEAVIKLLKDIIMP